jgi:hypothetical protein
MITLTLPIPVKIKLGANDSVNYDKMVLDNIELSTTGLTINAAVVITSTAAPTKPAITGSLSIQGGTLQIQVERLDFYERIAPLSGPQVAAITTIIRNAQNALEAGLISLGVTAGTQSTGA